VSDYQLKLDGKDNKIEVYCNRNLDSDKDRKSVSGLLISVKIFPLCYLIDINNSVITSPDSFHSIQDDGERDANQSTQDDMILSTCILNLNIINLFFL
jgi:hypothetical protein